MSKLTRFDHVVLAVRDIDTAIAAFTAAGFSVSRGGKHTGRGTCNAIIRFGLDYLELLSVYDDDAAVAAGKNGEYLVPFLKEHDGGLLGFAMATDSIEDLAEQFSRVKLDALGPFRVSRALPDGNTFDWRLLVIGGGGFRKTWPTIIQWDTSDADRLRVEPALPQSNGVTRVRGVKLVVPNLDAARSLYEEKIGLSEGKASHCEAFNAKTIRYTVGDFSVEIMEPQAEGVLKDALEGHGTGLFQVDLETSSIASALELLDDAERTPEDPQGILLPTELTLGSRLALFPAN